VEMTYKKMLLTFNLD